MGGLFQQDDAFAGFGGGQRGLQACDAAANHQHIGKGVDVFISVCVAVFWRFAKASCLADNGFKQVLPEGARMDEGFVVKSGGHEAGGVVVDDADIVIQAGPVVLAGSLQTVEQLGRGGALVRLQPRTLPQIHQGVGFLRTGGHNAARAVVFEAAADQHLVIGQQGRGEGIARKPAQAFAVEGELLRRSAVDQAATGMQTCAHLKPSQSGRFALILAWRSAGGPLDCAG